MRWIIVLPLLCAACSLFDGQKPADITKSQEPPAVAYRLEDGKTMVDLHQKAVTFCGRYGKKASKGTRESKPNDNIVRFECT